MKRRNYFFKGIFTLLFFFILTSTMGIVATLPTKAETATNPLNISYCNLSFENEVHLLYAIKEEDENVQLLVWEEVQEEYTYGTQTASLSPLFAQADINGELYTVFEYNGLSAKQMTDNVYVRAYLSTTEEYGDVYKYSILQYAYNKIGKTGTACTNEKFVNMLNKMLEYGAATQEYQGYRTDNLATDNFSQIILTDGTLPDGFKKGLYKVGSNVTISAPSIKANGEVFENWVDKDNTIIADTAEYVLTVGEGNNTYTPKYLTYSQGLLFTSNGDGTCRVSGIGTCTDIDLVIPTISPNREIVTSVGNKAFYNCNSLTSITLPDSVTSIGDSAFDSCSSLSEIIIPDSIKSIGSAPFAYCNNLHYNIYDNAEYLGNENNPYLVLVGAINASITSCTIYSNTKIICHAFVGCSNLSKIVIPNSVIGIGVRAFDSCYRLNEIVIPEGVTSIGDYTFYSCYSLSKIIIPNSVTSIGDFAFFDSSLNEIVIPSNVTSIGDFAFSGTSLSEIVIPNSVTSIGDFVFSYCSSLNNIIVKEDNQYYKDIEGNLYTKNGEKLLQYARGKKEPKFIIPDSVTSIGDSAFEDCKNLEIIIILNSVTSIGDFAFNNCNNLTIYCEIAEEDKPSGWNTDWNHSNCPVVWDCKNQVTE